MLNVGDIIRGEKVVKKFVKGKNVFLVKNETSNNFRVLKILEDGVVAVDEIRIGMNLASKCPYLMRIYEVLSCGPNVHLLMEYCEGGDVQERIEKNTPMSDREIYCFTFEGASALDVLHKAGIIHRDIKPANFLILPTGECKLGDYGEARYLDTRASRTMTAVGTPGYICPEILDGAKVYDSKVDVYAFGVTLLHFIIGQHPFSNENGQISVLRMGAGKPNAAALTHPHPVAKIALRMISVDPALRPSAAEVLGMLAAVPLIAPFHALALECGRAQAHAQVKEQELAQARREIEDLRREAETLKNLAASAPAPPPASHKKDKCPDCHQMLSYYAAPPYFFACAKCGAAYPAAACKRNCKKYICANCAVF